MFIRMHRYINIYVLLQRHLYPTAYTFPLHRYTKDICLDLYIHIYAYMRIYDLEYIYMIHI